VKVFITGAGGFIGGHLVEREYHNGHEVMAVDLHFSRKPIISNRVQYIQGDFRDTQLLETYLSNSDLIFHLASVHLQKSIPREQYWSVNVDGIVKLLEYTQKYNVQKFVHVSSVGVYGDIKTPPANEYSECHPLSIYGITKLKGEEAVIEFYSKTRYPVTILRPAWVYGPYCPRTMKLFRSIEKGRFLMIGKGENLRHPIFISDFLDAIDLAVQNNMAVGEVILIAGNEILTLAEMIEAFYLVVGKKKSRFHFPLKLAKGLAFVVEKSCGLVGVEPPLSKRSLEFFTVNNAFDISKARRILGFHPKVSFKEGLRMTYNWLLEYRKEN